MKAVIRGLTSSLDYKKLIFSRTDVGWIVLIVETGEAKVLEKMVMGSPSWSPDGKFILAIDRTKGEPDMAESKQCRRKHDYRPGKATQKPAREIKAQWLKRMKSKLETETGRALYARRKQTVEPVFGIIKPCMGFRQFLLRGVEKVTGEWQLVTMAYNFKRLWNLKMATA